MNINSKIDSVTNLTTRLIKNVFVDTKVKKVYNIQTKINNKVFLVSKQEPRVL